MDFGVDVCCHSCYNIGGCKRVILSNVNPSLRFTYVSCYLLNLLAPPCTESASTNHCSSHSFLVIAMI